MATDQSKVQAVLNWQIPSTLKKLRGVLGLTGYYWRFITSCASIATPLTNLLKKDVFGGTLRVQQRFSN